MSITFVDNSDEILRALGEACERGLFRCGEKGVEYAKDLFLFESGLAENSEWAQNEEMVDFFAIQFPKLMEAFKNADAI